MGMALGVNPEEKSGADDPQAAAEKVPHPNRL